MNVQQWLDDDEEVNDDKYEAIKCRLRPTALPQSEERDVIGPRPLKFQATTLI